jgi:hypothetical protein
MAARCLHNGQDMVANATGADPRFRPSWEADAGAWVAKVSRSRRMRVAAYALSWLLARIDDGSPPASRVAELEEGVEATCDLLEALVAGERQGQGDPLREAPGAASASSLKRQAADGKVVFVCEALCRARSTGGEPAPSQGA